MTDDKFEYTLDGTKKYTRIFRDIAGYKTKGDYIPYIEITCDKHPEIDHWICNIEINNYSQHILIEEEQLDILGNTLKEIKILIDEQRK